MKINYLLLFSILSIPRILIVRSKKTKREETEESVSEEATQTYYIDAELILTGAIRRYFGVDAVSSDIKNNVVCSPMAAMLPLGKLAYGADHVASSEMLAANGITSRAKLGSAMRKIIKILEYLPNVGLKVASNIFVSNKYQTDSNFEKKCSVTFTSLIQQVNCENDYDIAEDINKWVCNNTDHSVRHIIKSKQFCSEKSLIIANGVYFKGEWQKPFLKSYIKDFHSVFGIKRIPMMVVDDVFMYGRSNVLNAQIVEIPYKDDRTSFIIVLPFYDDGLPSILKNLKETPTLLNLAFKNLRPREMILSIPKFKLTSEIDLKDLYEKMGVKTAMDPEYSGLSKIVQNQTLYISAAVQKVVLEITETGTNEEFIPPKHIDPIYMNLEKAFFFADRPFLFYVTTNREQLFVGIYNGIPSLSTNESESTTCFD